jgi:hypothetical protein
MARALKRVHEWTTERGPARLQQLDGGRDPVLFVRAELVPPRSKRVGVLDFPLGASIKISL